MKTWNIRLPCPGLDPRSFSMDTWYSASLKLRAALAAEGFIVYADAVWPDYDARSVSFYVSHSSDSAVTWYTLKYPDTLCEFTEL